MAVSYQEYQQAQSDVRLYEQRVSSFQIKVLELQQDYNTYSAAIAAGEAGATPNILNNIQKKLTQATDNLNFANIDLATAKTTVATFQNSPLPEVSATDPIKTPLATNPSATDAVAAEKQATATIEGTPPTVDDRNEASDEVSASNAALNRSGKPSSDPKKDAPAIPKFKGGSDHRVRLKVPVSYVSGIHTQGPNQTLFKSQGIIFPYTPTIGQEYTASYNALPVIHSNYAQQFYKNSSVGNISLSAKFTVQNEYEANVYFSIVHLLRALTKMRWGDDENAGSPPPVCRLFAYGNGIMNNVPVAIASFKLDLPDNIDYFVTKDLSSAPVLSTIGITLIPIYSRNEIQQFTVDKWLTGDLRNKGYL